MNTVRKTKNTYFSLVREELFPLLPASAKNVLEVGCGTGATLAELKKQGYVQNTYGVELDTAAAQKARRVVDHVYQGDVEHMKLPFRRHQFAVILLPDVIEHVRDPWQFLHKLHPYLAQGGRLVISVPNVQHFTVLRQLLRGRWDYQEAGIMDRTHLHFFTRQTILEALEQAGYEVLEVRANGGYLPGWKGWLNWLTGNRLQTWFVAQWLIAATPRKKSTTLTLVKPVG